MNSDADSLIHAVLDAYAQGLFPMADPEDPDAELGWYDPDPRAVIPLETDPDSPDPAFHIPRRLRTRLRTAPFVVTTDRAFGDVIRACAEPRRDGCWIDARIVTLFELLHEQGHAHSIEVWRCDPDPRDPPDPFDPAAPRPIDPRARPPEGARLVGGLYGLAVGALFAGECMFSLPAQGGADASKIALVRTVFHLRHHGFRLFDSQFWNEHLDQFGCVEIPRMEYRRRVSLATASKTRWNARLGES